MPNEKSGVLHGTPWSETESKRDLYEFARDLELPGINSRSSKPDLVSALVKAQKKQDQAEAKAAVAAAPAKTAAKPTARRAPKAKAKAKAVAPKPAPTRGRVSSARAQPARRDLAAEARVKKAERKAKRAQGGRGRG